MSDIKRLTPPQSRKVNTLVRRTCCNCDNGNCILLDDGDECVCPQLISYSLLCKWFRIAVLPADKELYAELSREFMVDYDETGSIGKRYRREDEIGTPYCITFDFDTVGDEANGIAADHCVTIRERDSMEQVRIPIDQVRDFLREKCAF